MAASMRYIVEDVPAAIAFYERLGFQTAMHPAPGFAAMCRNDLRLLLNAPGAGGAGQPSDDGQVPTPGGWNRIQLQVTDLAGIVEALSAEGLRVRTSIIDGRGGRQAVIEDPSGNPVELFQPSSA
jgi:catechol 2,3-dioxygenase-like lactoylglutathione lyase family enzyme